tara:strand:- start:510 stop:1220 length:711 start_codon:yes stop_codon:yes gene_type:complete
MSLVIREQYREAGLSPQGKKISPKHFKYRWETSDFYKNKREAKEKELKDTIENWNGKMKTCSTCKKSFPLIDEFWVKHNKRVDGTQHYYPHCGENANGCYPKTNIGGKGFKSSRQYRKTQKEQVLKDLIWKLKKEDEKKGLVCDLDLEWALEQEKKGSVDAKRLYGVKYLSFSYEDVGHNLSNPMGPSLDRIDSTKAHTKDNTQMIWRLNHLGWKNTPPEWREKTYKVLEKARKDV